MIAIDTLTRYELGTLPLFLLMAHLFFSADASRDLFDVAARFVGHRRGGLAYAAVGRLRRLRRDQRVEPGDRGDDRLGGAARDAPARLFRLRWRPARSRRAARWGR